MRYFILLIILCCFSCGNERILHLPEIENAEVTEVLDVSPAYIFYDETQPDSTLLNRKNLISTTNWLVNVDKQLTLRQIIPHIKFLQDKKRNAKMHKNENAKNYFTCNDTSIGDLGFVEFTDINYYDTQNELSKEDNVYFMNIESLSNINFSSSLDLNMKFSKENFISIYNELLKKEHGESLKIIMSFNSSMSFQDYITVKSELSKIDNSKFIIDTNEFIY